MKILFLFIYDEVHAEETLHTKSVEAQRNEQEMRSPKHLLVVFDIETTGFRSCSLFIWSQPPSPNLNYILNTNQT